MTHTQPFKIQEVEISVDVTCACSCTRTLSVLHFLIIIYQIFGTVFYIYIYIFQKDSSIKIGLKSCTFNYEGIIILIIHYLYPEVLINIFLLSHNTRHPSLE